MIRNRPDGGVEPGAVLRVLSYNVHRWGDDRSALARVVRACDPDLALIQEAPTWWGTRRKRQAMAASFALTYAAGSARNAILVAEGTELVATRSWRIWRPFFRPWRNLFATQLPGGAVGAVTGGTAVVVCHLGLHPRGRRSEIEQVVRGGRAFGAPYLLAGDLNEEPGGPVWQLLTGEGLTDLGAGTGPTFPAGGPTRRIDGALVTSGVTGRIVALDTVPGLTRDDLAAASDHLPLLVELVRAEESGGRGGDAPAG